MNDRTRLLVELHARGLTRAHLKRADAILQERGREGLIAAIPTLAPRAANRPPSASALRTLCDFVERGGALITEERALSRLTRAPSPPLLAYARGHIEALQRRPAIAIVGARAPSERARRRTHRWASELAARDVVVISGGALGIDSAAHRGALERGGTSVVVLGEPVGAFPGRALTLERLAGECLLISAHGPWVKRSKGLFVSRNRLIAALSDALLVIEGNATSGTRHTARFATQLGVPIFAVPGDPDDPRAATPNALIASGLARPILNLDDLEPYIGPISRPPPTRTPLEQTVLARIKDRGGVVALDELSEIGEQVHACIASLEIDGVLERRGPQLFLVTS